MSSSSDAEVEAVVDAQLGAVKELDEDIFAYILGIVKDVDAHGCDPETLAETVSQRQTATEAERWGGRGEEYEKHVGCLCSVSRFCRLRARLQAVC